MHADLEVQIMDLEREIARLPQGSIAKKTIRGKEYYYHRIHTDGKRKETYISFEEYPALKMQIERRQELEKELRNLKKSLPDSKARQEKKQQSQYKTIVRIGAPLANQIAIVKNYRKRECYGILRDYVLGDPIDKVFILYGLRRTGKTTMIRQMLADLPKSEFSRAAFIQVTSKDTLSEINADLRLLEHNGYKYVFIDEVTLMEDFIEGAALFSDIYASSGMKIVLSGTDSLGFAFTKENQLYDRCIMLHTTFISYREFEEVLGIKGIDEYIRYGGTMSIGGVNYNTTTPFTDARNSEEYIDTAIARNIQHSLKMYQYGGHFRSLLDLYERGELTNVINRVVENINHSFARSVIDRTFHSHDLSVTASNLLRDRDMPINFKEHIDLDTVTKGIKDVLDILNKEEQHIQVEESHMIQIKEYLTLLDLIMEIDLEFLPDVSKRNTITVLTQPGLRYAQATAIIDNVLLDEKFQELTLRERKRIVDRLMSEISGRMMEEIVLLETKLAHPDKHVFKLQFATGEFDMVISDSETLSCEIFEVKYSREAVKEQYVHLKDKEKCSMTERRYGEIAGRYVIYRGSSTSIDGIKYVNVEEYLKSL